MDIIPYLVRVRAEFVLGLWTPVQNLCRIYRCREGAGIGGALALWSYVPEWTEIWGGAVWLGIRLGNCNLLLDFCVASRVREKVGIGCVRAWNSVASMICLGCVTRCCQVGCWKRWVPSIFICYMEQLGSGLGSGSSRLSYLQIFTSQRFRKRPVADSTDKHDALSSWCVCTLFVICFQSKAGEPRASRPQNVVELTKLGRGWCGLRADVLLTKQKKFLWTWNETGSSNDCWEEVPA